MSCLSQLKYPTAHRIRAKCFQWKQLSNNINSVCILGKWYSPGWRSQHSRVNVSWSEVKANMTIDIKYLHKYNKSLYLESRAKCCRHSNGCTICLPCLLSCAGKGVWEMWQGWHACHYLTARLCQPTQPGCKSRNFFKWQYCAFLLWCELFKESLHDSKALILLVTVWSSAGH